MAFTEKFLMWGFIPVAFNSKGEWDIDVDHQWGKKALDLVAVGLLKVNAAVEWLCGHKVVLTPPLVPRRVNLSSYKA